ncbi:hypothetical protein A2U01_0062097, partial [Trifolium medium]|nr:hypothetical protein [Trifolium medium]
MLDTIDDVGSPLFPSRYNVQQHIFRLVDSLAKEDSLFIYFSCHGGRLEVEENDGFQEFVVLAD